jgi:light-regulated signal transduction histidine kinase (bacteriophytochrome)
VTDLSDRRLAEQEIHQRRERETLLNDISAKIRSTLDLQTILRVAVQRLRQALETDRVLAYQLFPDNSGICLAEDVSVPYPVMLGLTLPSECIPSAYLDAYRQGRLWSTPDVHNAQLADCYQGMLTQFRVRGMIAAAIVSMDDTLEPQHRTL